MVIFNHSNDRGFYRYAINDIGSFSWILSTLASAICKAGVPLFFMIAGANLLGKKESYSKTFFRTRRIVLCLIIWSGIYFYMDSFLSRNFLEPLEFIRQIISSNYWHLWYLYAYIAFIITLPLLRSLAQNIGLQEIYLLVVLAFTLTFVVPVIETFAIPLYGSLKPSWVVSNIFLYPVLGFYIDKKLNFQRVQNSKMYVLWIFNVVIIALGEIFEYLFLCNNPDDRSEVFLAVTCLTNAICIFMTIKYLYEKRIKVRKNITNKAIIFWGKKTFGIYLVHIIILWKIPFLMKIYECIEAYSSLGIFVSVLICFIISGIATWLLEMLPIIKEII